MTSHEAEALYRERQLLTLVIIVLTILAACLVDRYAPRVVQVFSQSLGTAMGGAQ